MRWVGAQTVLGILWLAACGPPEEPKTPVDMQRACAADRLRSCIGLAYAYATGRGVEIDPARAAGLYQKACDGGLLVGCVNLGVQFALGSGVPEDRATALRLFRNACERGPPGEESVPVACLNLGVILDLGVDPAPGGQDEPEGLFERSCRGGFAPGCRYAGLSLMPREPIRGEAFLARACTGGDALGCSLAERVKRGETVEFDETIIFAKVNYHY